MDNNSDMDTHLSVSRTKTIGFERTANPTINGKII